jgi:hypothetical protein
MCVAIFVEFRLARRTSSETRPSEFPPVRVGDAADGLDRGQKKSRELPFQVKRNPVAVWRWPGAALTSEKSWPLAGHWITGDRETGIRSVGNKRDCRGTPLGMAKRKNCSTRFRPNSHLMEPYHTNGFRISSTKNLAKISRRSKSNTFWRASLGYRFKPRDPDLLSIESAFAAGKFRARRGHSALLCPQGPQQSGSSAEVDAPLGRYPFLGSIACEFFLTRCRGF